MAEVRHRLPFRTKQVLLENRSGQCELTHYQKRHTVSTYNKREQPLWEKNYGEYCWLRCQYSPFQTHSNLRLLFGWDLHTKRVRSVWKIKTCLKEKKNIKKKGLAPILAMNKATMQSVEHSISVSKSVGARESTSEALSRALPGTNYSMRWNNHTEHLYVPPRLASLKGLSTTVQCQTGPHLPTLSLINSPKQF